MRLTSCDDVVRSMPDTRAAAFCCTLPIAWACLLCGTPKATAPYAMRNGSTKRLRERFIFGDKTDTRLLRLLANHAGEVFLLEIG